MFFILLFAVHIVIYLPQSNTRYYVNHLACFAYRYIYCLNMVQNTYLIIIPRIGYEIVGKGS